MNSIQGNGSTLHVVGECVNRIGKDHFIKRPAATFFVTVEGGGMAEHGILAGDTLIVDRSRTPGTGSIVIAAIEGELTARPFAALDGEEAHVWGVVAGVVRSLP